MANVNLKEVIKGAKTLSEKKALIRKYPSLSREILNKPQDSIRMYIYPPIEWDDNSIAVPDDIGQLMSIIDDAAQKDEISEESMAIYETISTILATPAAILHTTIKSMLNDIVDEIMDIEAGIEDEPYSAGDSCEITAKVNTDTSFDEDISDEELMKEFLEEPKHEQND